MATGQVLEQYGKSGDGQTRQQNVDTFTLSPDDIVIGVMGLTGSGKSTLISTLTGQDIPIGYDLKSCTSKVDIYTTDLNGRAIFFLDTPGFDDTFRSDTEVLKDVAFFLSTIYAHKIKLAGMIYLHRITDPKLGGSALKNLHMFEKLCGKDSLKSIVLTTTMWEILAKQGNLEVGEERERQLLENEKFWGFMAQRGSKVVRHDGSQQSAWNMVSYLIDKQRSVVLDIQRQMVDERQTLDNTSAGKVVQEELQKLREKHRRDLTDLEESHQYALAEKDEEMIEQIHQQQEQYREQLEQAERDRASLKIDLEHLIEDHKQQSERRIREIEQDRQKLADQLNTKAFELVHITDRMNSMEHSMARQDQDHQRRIHELIDSQAKQSETDRRNWEQELKKREENWRREELDLAQMNRDREAELKAALERDIALETALTKRKGMTISLLQTLSSLGGGAILTGIGLQFGNPVVASAGLGLACGAFNAGQQR